MQRLFDRDSTNLVIRALRHLQIRLTGRPETAPLAEEVKARRGEVTARFEAAEEAKETRIAATAEIHYLDGRLDAATQDVARKVLVEARGDRSDPRYRRIFAVAPGQGMAPVAGAGQARYVRAVADALEQDPALAAEAPPLREQLAALEAAEARREELYVPEARTRAELQAALDGARRLYNTMHARLTLLFPEDPRLVESFFATLHGRRAAGEDEAEDAG